jgi:cytochrome P450
MLHLARNIISNIMFGTYIDGSPEHLRDIFTQGMEWNRWRLLKTTLNWPTLRNRSFQQAQEQLDRIVSDIIRDYHENDASTIFLDTLLHAKRDGSLTDQDVRDEILNILVVGHLTTGAVLTWTLSEMIKHPAIAKAVRSECQHILVDKVLHPEDIQRLTYTKKVIQETIRLYPPVWGFTRKITNTLVLGDKVLPQNSRVLISPYSTHRHPTYWAQPEVFDPQRFQGEQPEQRHSPKYFPYGYGKRQCPGKELATLIAMMVIPTLLQQFRLVAISTEPIEPLARSTLIPRQEILITVESADA